MVYKCVSEMSGFELFIYRKVIDEQTFFSIFSNFIRKNFEYSCRCILQCMKIKCSASIMNK